MKQIYLIGNPAIMYVCIIFALSFFFCLIFYSRYRYLMVNDAELARLVAKGVFLLSAYSLNLFPYIAVDRSAFLYHYIPGLLYAQLLTALMIDSFPKQGQKWVVLILVIVESAAFIYWAPWIYCIPLSTAQHQKRRLLPRWN